MLYVDSKGYIDNRCNINQFLINATILLEISVLAIIDI